MRMPVYLLLFILRNKSNQHFHLNQIWKDCEISFTTSNRDYYVMAARPIICDKNFK